MKTAINNTFGNLTFDPDLFPVPAENQLSFCNDLNLSAIDNIRGDLIKVARIGSLVLIGLALLLTGLNCLGIWYRWRSMKSSLGRTRQVWALESSLNPTKSSESEPQMDEHTRSFPSRPRNSTSSEKQTNFSVSKPQMSGHTKSFSSTPQNVTLSEKQANFSGSEPQMNGHIRSFPSTAQKSALGEKHANPPGSEPRPSRSFPLSEKHAKSSGSEPQMDAHTRSFPRDFTPSEKHTKSSGPEPQMDAHTSFPSTPQGLAVGEEHGKSSGPKPQMDVRTRSFPSAPQNITPSDPTLKHTESSGVEPQMNGDTRFSPSAPQVTLNDHNLLRLQADSQHPLITRFANFLAARTGMTPSQNIDMRWFLQYVFHPPALACFLIGFFGLLSVMIQLFLLGPLLSAARAGVQAVVSDFSDNIANSINQSMYNQSAAYANGINSKVDVVQSTINTALFGWINGSTTLLNTTINNFYTEVEHLVSNLFNGTILEDPALNFVQCLIGNKVDDIEEALTFLQDNLAITIPRIADDILVLSAQSINEATAPIASAAVGNGGSGSQGLIGGAIALYEDSLREEVLVFGIFMGIWGIVLSMGICVLLWRAHKRKQAVIAAKRQKLDLDKGDKHVEADTFSPTDEKEDIWMN